MNPVIDCLCSRRSVRCYSNRQVNPDDLQAVLRAGTFAATAHGRQDPWIVAVQKPDIIQRLVAMNAAVMGTTDNPYYGAPTIVLDGALVLGNMMNAAHSLGLASCWINREREMFATDEGRELMRSFGLPDGLIGIGALSLGYADGEPKSPKDRKPDYFRVIA